MAFFRSPPRQAITSLTCPCCGNALDIRRTCHEAYMYCPACAREFPLADYIPRMDDVMEHFLEQLFVDRV